MSRPGTVIDVETAKLFLLEAERYFSNRPTGGEDSAYWANVYNAKNCKKISELLDKLTLDKLS